MNNNPLSKYLGCLIGGAAGDALGYTVEFMSENRICSVYGEDGIADFELGETDTAQISDDTQMTLFTAAGLISAEVRAMQDATTKGRIEYIYESYIDWLHTQNNSYNNRSEGLTWLVNEKRLYSLRAPGNTCLFALESGKAGSAEQPVNDSKGCGGIMRVAPIGLLWNGDDTSITDTIRLGAEAAAITHGHELGYIPAAALAEIIALATHTDMLIEEIVSKSINDICEIYKNKNHIDEFRTIMNKAVELSYSDIDDLHAIHILGEGWVAEETLAIAVNCALKYKDNYDKAIICAVNHGGDSDSTGAVCGNILGAYLGAEHIPQRYIVNLEMLDIICETAIDLYNIRNASEREKKSEAGILSNLWNSKYISGTFAMPERYDKYEMLSSIWDFTVEELEQNLLYHDCIHLFFDTLDERLRNSLLREKLSDIDCSMAVNMGGGVPKNTFEIMIKRLCIIEGLMNSNSMYAK